MNFFGKKNESRMNDKIKKPIVHLDFEIHHEFSKSQTVQLGFIFHFWCAWS